MESLEKDWVFYEELDLSHISYDQGWNAFIEGVEYTSLSCRDWKDGWKDAKECFENNPELLVKI